jgi:threonine/homoserine/homoserine lactone efflux protein
MPSTGTLLALIVASIALVAFPGPNLFYIVTRSVNEGWRPGIVSAAGVETATLIHVVAATAGLSAVVAASATALLVVQYAGAAYLGYLGLRALLAGGHGAASGHAAPAGLRRVYRDGVLVNLFNPKIALFFLAFLPQFVTPGASARWQMLVLGLVFFVLALTLDLAYALTAGVVGARLQHNSGRRGQRYVTGAVYLGLGACAALFGGPRPH